MLPSPRRRTGAYAFLAFPALLGAVVILFSLSASAQDLATFLSAPPAPGAWARYRIETTNPSDPNAPVKVKLFTLKVTGSATEDGQDLIWVEASPMDLANEDDGTLRLLLKLHPTSEEALNPLLQARTAQYLPVKGEAYSLSEQILSFFQGQLKGVKASQVRKPLSNETILVSGQGPIPCERAEVTTQAEGTVLFKTRNLVEKGTQWTTEKTPFRLVKADITRTELKDGKPPRIRNVSIRLEEASFTGARSAFPAQVTKTRGLFSLLFD